MERALRHDPHRDSGRAFVPKDYREVLWEESVDVDSDLEGKEKRLVRILRY